MRLVKFCLLAILVGMMVLRTGTFVVRIAKEIGQPMQIWHPANANEQLIWENYGNVK